MVHFTIATSVQSRKASIRARADQDSQITVDETWTVKLPAGVELTLFSGIPMDLAVKTVSAMRKSVTLL